jgi:hypothetical protein
LVHRPADVFRLTTRTRHIGGLVKAFTDLRMRTATA